MTDDALLRQLAELYRARWDGRWQLEIQDGAVVSKFPGSRLEFFEVTPRTARSHAKAEPSGQTTYRF